MKKVVDPFDLKGQEEAQKEAKKLADFEEKTETEDLKWVMSNKRGRRFVWRLMERTGIYRTSFTGNSTTFFNEGQRNIGLMLVSEIHEVCPDQYTLMVKENRSVRNIDDASRK